MPVVALPLLSLFIDIKSAASDVRLIRRNYNCHSKIVRTAHFMLALMAVR
jgi:hypothetical protein